jgi:hypothetical protein
MNIKYCKKTTTIQNEAQWIWNTCTVKRQPPYKMKQLHFVWWLSFYSISYSLSFILYGGCLFTVFYIHWASFCMVVVFLQYFIFIELHFVWWLSFYSIKWSSMNIKYCKKTTTIQNEAQWIWNTVKRQPPYKMKLKWLSFYSILYSLSFILYGGCLFTVFYIHRASFCMVVVFLQYFIFIELHFVWSTIQNEAEWI